MKYQALFEDREIALNFLTAIFEDKEIRLSRRKQQIEYLSKSGLKNKDIQTRLNITKQQLYYAMKH